MKLIATYFLSIVSVGALSISFFGCGSKGDSFFYSTLGLNDGRILVSYATTAPVSYGVAMYDINGNFLQIVKDTSSIGLIPRGTSIFDEFNILIASDTPDSLRKVNLLTGYMESYTTNLNLSGNIYGMAKRANNQFLVIETNNIELFSGNTRIGAPFIGTVVGGCTISAARGLAINSLGDLIVASFGNGRVLRYDISTSSPSCSDSNVTIGANQPIPLAVHPNGNVYIGTQTNDTIYELPEAFTGADVAATIISGTTYTNNPTAIAVLPNGNLLVGSD